MTGAYTDVAACLKRRGWFYNTDPESMFFHLQASSLAESSN